MMRIVAILAVALIVSEPTLADDVGSAASDAPAKTNGRSFTAATIDGEGFKLEPGFEAELVVVCFFGVECPLAKLYTPRLNRMVDDYEGRVRLIAVDSNSQDSLADLQEFANKHECKFTFIKDDENRIADQFQAERTPEVFVLDRELEIKSRGRIDDQFFPGITRSEPRRRDLREAIDQLLAGESVSVPRTQAVGCIIGRVKKPLATSSVTYSKQISRILQKHCLECHREGEIGPFAMTDYDEVTGWAEMMLEVVDQGRMPPWHANPDFGHFANARHMPSHEKELLRKWVEAGTPYGDVAELPQSDSFQFGDTTQEPDLVIPMRDSPFEVPADGVVDYQYFVVDPEFTEDKWVKAIKVVPGNPSVVHHSIVFVRPPDGAPFRGLGWLADYIPGKRMEPISDTQAKRIPAGSKLVFQQHYTPNGRVQSDLTKAELFFADDSQVTDEKYTILGIDQDFEIPPGDPNLVVKSKVSYLPRGGQLLSIIPHMHFRGKSFRVVATRGSTSEIMLDVPAYDFNWQHSYQLTDPISLADIDRIEFEATFDNSEANPNNPNPDEYIYWGEQTWQEMALVMLEVAIPRDLDRKALSPRRQTQTNSLQDQENQFVEEFLERFDKNKNGTVSRDESTIALRRSGFRQVDKDRDGKLSPDELKAAFRRRTGR